jgi:hypothetical protein
MSFIPPMLATRPKDPRRLADPRYIAETQARRPAGAMSLSDHRTIYALSRSGRELIRLPGCQGRGELSREHGSKMSPVH